MRVISFGGGVQSTALLVLACRGELEHVDAVLFANVGDDSENRGTLEYLRQIAMPYAERHARHIDELRRRTRDGQIRTLYGELTTRTSRSVAIPVRMSGTGAPGRRRCTADYKMKVIGRWCREHGASTAAPATVIVGISWDEIERLGNQRNAAWERREYPLIDRRLTRDDCKAIIHSAGLAVPPKSSCFFCPFRRPSEFARMRRDEPIWFWKAADLETTLNDRRRQLGKDPVYLTRFGRPLADAITAADPALDFGSGPGETCDEGYCWT